MGPVVTFTQRPFPIHSLPSEQQPWGNEEEESDSVLAHITHSSHWDPRLLCNMQSMAYVVMTYGSLGT